MFKHYGKINEYCSYAETKNWVYLLVFFKYQIAQYIFRLNELIIFTTG